MIEFLIWCSCFAVGCMLPFAVSKQMDALGERLFRKWTTVPAWVAEQDGKLFQALLNATPSNDCGVDIGEALADLDAANVSDILGEPIAMSVVDIL